MEMSDDFVQPDDVYRGEVCSATGNRATSGGTTTAWLVRGDGPDNACGDLTDYQREELEKAIDSLRERDARFASGAINSVREYADAAGVRGVRAPAGNDDDRPGDRDSGDDEDDDDEEQIIEPLN
jgi:hypothetical protein